HQFHLFHAQQLLFTNSKYSPEFYSSFGADSEDNNNNKRLIYLPGSTLEENEQTIKSFIDSNNATAPVVYLLTGKDNEYLKQNRRSRREANSPKPKVLQSPETDPCVYLYTETVQLVTKEATFV